MDWINWLRTPLGGRRRGRSCGRRERSVSVDMTNAQIISTPVTHKYGFQNTQIDTLHSSHICSDNEGDAFYAENRSTAHDENNEHLCVYSDVHVDEDGTSVCTNSHREVRTNLLTQSLSLFQLSDESGRGLFQEKNAHNQTHTPASTLPSEPSFAHPEAHGCVSKNIVNNVVPDAHANSGVQEIADYVRLDKSSEPLRTTSAMRNVYSAPDLNKRRRDEACHSETCDMHTIKATYVIVRALAAGSRTGRVCLVRHRESGALAVWKEQTLTASDRIYVHNEAQIHSLCDHPHIARVIHVAHTQNSLTLVMEYLGGEELFAHIKPSIGLEDKSQVREYMVQLVSAISYLHGIGIAHRDIKPENIVCTTNGKSVKLVDFGMSEYVHVDRPVGKALVVSGNTLNNKCTGRCTGVHTDSEESEHSVGNGQRTETPSLTNTLARDVVPAHRAVGLNSGASTDRSTQGISHADTRGNSNLSNGAVTSDHADSCRDTTTSSEACTNMSAGVRYRLNVGTTNFMAPELLYDTDREFGTVDLKACDVWALGVCLFCMCTGRFPWSEATDKCVGYRCYSAREHTSQDLWLRIPAPAMVMLSHMLAIDVSRRWTINEVQAYLQSEWPPAKPINHTHRSRASGKKPNPVQKLTPTAGVNSTASAGDFIKCTSPRTQKGFGNDGKPQPISNGRTIIDPCVQQNDPTLCSATQRDTTALRPVTPTIITTSYCSPPTQKRKKKRSYRTDKQISGDTTKAYNDSQSTCLSTTAMSIYTHEKIRPSVKIRGRSNARTKGTIGGGRVYLEVPVVSFACPGDDSGFESEEYSRQASASIKG
ncbi:serine/threonine protein kinase [Sphaeroforma arctica JP610]|uniref:Serine/threonine protein kinase n=1 Tax=Sphaeroforma arctica JP610 TaxID=667725 RepID=A0A0L0G0H1_9EUKA|nr:serine/threonine protein kinase [Sphaeroforma arctica JP610]KNC82341.1 serine/threonine protein kinase [Sphaeroforma arctica JP610]|eukprot:XP_014156243.1 serine/threonine protein kinase [Sphaeroforma arctica JP610]